MVQSSVVNDSQPSMKASPLGRTLKVTSAVGGTYPQCVTCRITARTTDREAVIVLLNGTDSKTSPHREREGAAGGHLLQVIQPRD